MSTQTKEKKNYKNEEFRQTIYINGNVETDPSITIARPPFLLERYDFDKIIRSESYLQKIGNLLIGSAIALFINMIAKLIGNKIDPKIAFDEWEVYAFGIAIILTIIVFAINEFIPNEKRKIIKKIKEYFEKN